MNEHRYTLSRSLGLMHDHGLIHAVTHALCVWPGFSFLLELHHERWHRHTLSRSPDFRRWGKKLVHGHEISHECGKVWPQCSPRYTRMTVQSQSKYNTWIRNPANREISPTIAQGFPIPRGILHLTNYAIQKSGANRLLNIGKVR